MMAGDEPLRLFVAMMAPPAVQAVMTTAQVGLQAAARPVRWSDPAGAHITLQFLGATVPGRQPALTVALAGVAATARPLVLRTASLGVFPNPSQARVVWLGLTGDIARLAALQRAVLAATRPLGFAAEVRPFTPHLTLGRVSDGATSAERTAIGTAVAQAPPPASAVWSVEGLALMASTLGPRGATYRVVERWRFVSAELSGLGV